MLTEDAHVALCLSSVARLFLSFQSTNCPARRQLLLCAAGDMLDRTMPPADVKSALASCSDQVGTLVRQRRRIAAVPPGLWRKSRVSPNDLGAEHYAGWRAVERALRKDFSRPQPLWAAVEQWLAPAWARYPELKPEALSARHAATS